MPATNELLQEGRYRVSQPANGDGSVFEAYDTVRNTTVLVHEFPVKLNKVTTLSQQESMRLAFANQAKALSEIEHESLLHVQDYFSEIDRQYIVMESVEGEDVTILLDRNKRPFPVSQVLAWADQLLDALNYLHSRRPGIVHRNVRPQNLLLHPSGKIKLIGVGLDSGAEASLTLVAQGDGNLRYSPMEQIWPGLDAASQKVITHSYDDRSERILKEALDARSDIYSLGATLYFLMTGIEPVDPLERSIDMLEGKLDPLREPVKVDSSIPSEISDVLMKALEIKRENRYDSALIMRQVLKTAIARVEERSAAGADLETPAVSEPDQNEMLAAAEAAAIADAERRQKAELMRQQLREAEEQRKRAEQQAVEAAQLRMLEDQRTLEAELSTQDNNEGENSATTAEENLLEIPVSADVVAYRDTTEVDENELAAVLEELEKAERESITGKKAAFIQTLSPEPVATKVASDVKTETYEANESGLFAETEKRGFSLPIPAIAGGIGLIVVIGVGGWLAMSGSSEPPAKPAPVQIAQPQQPEANLSTEVPVTAQSQADANTLTGVDEASESANTAGKAAPTPKPKKADPKPAKEKKAVTVDDLINDN